MKYSIFSAVACMLMGGMACTGNTGYKITGTVENAQEGDTVILQEAVNGDLSPLETTVIRNGYFTFEGKQDSTICRYITSKIDGREYMVDFFLENGNITVSLAKEAVSATGTYINDIHQKVREVVDKAVAEIDEAYAFLRDTTLTNEQRKEGEEQVRLKEAAYYQIVKDCMKQQITNLVGVSLFKQMYRENTLEENDSLLQQVPAMYQTDQTIMKIKDRVENGKNTMVGKKFADFELQTLSGGTKKLSDFAGKGKVVLLDFWASWCGPCLKEMPNLVVAYDKYTDKGFEVIGISLDEDEEDWRGAVEHLKISWPQLSDLKGWKCKAAKLYAIQSIPYTVLIDGEGTIICRDLRGEELQKKLEEVLKD